MGRGLQRVSRFVSMAGYGYIQYRDVGPKRPDPVSAPFRGVVTQRQLARNRLSFRFPIELVPFRYLIFKAKG
jgi:hypothetical protein